MKKKSKTGPVVLLIIDGWGVASHQEQNPIELAQTPVMHSLWKNYPHTILEASGSAVGLLPNQDGNSEAGHMNIGAGRIVEQDVLKISKSIRKGIFQKNAAFEQAFSQVNKNNSNLHLLGLISDEHSAHSNPEHLRTLLEISRAAKVKNLFLHLFTDGRDSPKYAAAGFVHDLQKFLQPHEKIVTIMGRVYMDRKKDWKKTKVAYDTLVLGGVPEYDSAASAIQAGYGKGESDEFLEPRIIKNKHFKNTRINDGQAIIFFNLRSDRARQLSKPFVQTDFNKMNPGSFRRSKVLRDLIFVAMTDFGPDLENILTAYPSEDLDGTLPMALSKYRQLYIAETEKFAHITYFLNGGHTHSVGGEERIQIPSPDVSHYDKVPEMSTYQITDHVLQAIDQDKYDFIAINFANADMVGHSGNLEACIKAVKSIDECVGKLVKKIKKHNGMLFITADHGNVEEVINSATGEIDTEHSTNPVPFIIVSNRQFGAKKMNRGVLGHVAPTILDLMGVDKPYQMVYNSLLKSPNSK